MNFRIDSVVVPKGKQHQRMVTRDFPSEGKATCDVPDGKGKMVRKGFALSELDPAPRRHAIGVNFRPY